MPPREKSSDGADGGRQIERRMWNERRVVGPGFWGTVRGDSGSWVHNSSSQYGWDRVSRTRKRSAWISGRKEGEGGGVTISARKRFLPRFHSQKLLRSLFPSEVSHYHRGAGRFPQLPVVPSLLTLHQSSSYGDPLVRGATPVTSLKVVMSWKIGIGGFSESELLGIRCV